MCDESGAEAQLYTVFYNVELNNSSRQYMYSALTTHYALWKRIFHTVTFLVSLLLII